MNQQFLIFAIVIVPVLSVCLGFTVHYAIRPLIESLLDAIHELGSIASQPSGGDVARLEAEIAALRKELALVHGAASLDEAVRGESDRDRLPSGSA